MSPFFLCCGIKKVEPTHGTPPAAGIASFRSTTTKYNIPSKTKAVKWIFSGIDSLCVFICSYSVCVKILIPILNRLLRLFPPCIQIIQIPIGSLHIVIICTHSISIILFQQKTFCLKMKMKRGELIGFNGCLGYDYHPEDKSLSFPERCGIRTFLPWNQKNPE